MNQFQLGLHSDMKDLVFMMPNPSTLSQAIAQVVWCDNKFLNVDKKYVGNHHQHKRLLHFVPPQPFAISPKDDPMQIDEIWFKPFKK